MKFFPTRVPRGLRVFLAATWIANFFVASTLAQASDSREALFAKSRCPLTDMLRQVFEAPSAYQERDRYLVLSAPLIDQAYVQCMFAVNRTKLFCEASSGYYARAMDKPRRSFPSEDTKAAFRKLGFATGDDEKNYPYERDFTGTPDFGEIATLMLLAMHDGFGARAGTRLTVQAPFAKTVQADCGSKVEVRRFVD